ncbi:MAG: EAL domain-containing protein [Thermales bacterium]|nr:EAL domain-containing protein [Thermales bacterium]
MTGDEFAIVIKDQNNIDEVSKISQKLITFLSNPFKVVQNEIFITLSIGVVTNQIKSDSAKDYLRDAEIALNKAKKVGRGKFKIFDKKMYTNLLQQWNLESELQKAFKNNDFEIFYQPIYSVSRKKVYSFETLIRWNHPRFGYISPKKFLQSAEDIGIINPLDRWVMYRGSNNIKELSKSLGEDFNI